MPYSTEGIRNIALVGHSAAGKTTLFEALLHAGGTIQIAGSVERGTTVSDFDPMEKDRKQSLNTCVASVDRGDCHINIIDTPGAADFRGPTLSALAAVETCAIVVNAHNGIEYGTQRMMHHAKSRGLARVIVVNKIDGGNIAQARRRTARGVRAGMPAGESAGAGRQDGRRLFLQAAGRAGFFDGGRSASAHHRSGRRDQRERDESFPRQGRGRFVRAGIARRVRAVSARRPSGADLFRLRAHRRGREGIA